MANFLNNLLRKRSLSTMFTYICMIFMLSTASVYAASPTPCGGGNGEPSVKIAIDLGCKGHGNPVADLTFAIIRLLSDGVGLVVIGSIIVAGIQYTTSQDDPKATAAAQQRIRSSIVALIIFIFAYAILNYVIPAGFFRQ